MRIDSMKNGEVEKHFDIVAKKYDYYKNKNSFYYSNLKKLLRELIPACKRVMEVGTGTGDLLSSVKPKFGWGMDISSEMIKVARRKYKNKGSLMFATNWPTSKFEYIFMSDVIEHLENPQQVFKKISRLMNKDSILICTIANPIWEPILLVAEKLGLKMPEGIHKRITFGELRFIIKKSGLEVTRHDYDLLIPINIPFLTKFVNKYLEKYLKKYAFIEYLTAKLY